MWTLALVTTLAQAGTAVEEAQREVARDGASEMVVACSPFGSLLDLAHSIPLPPALADGARGKPTLELLLELRDPAVARAWGLDLAGPLVVSGGKVEGAEYTAVSLPFGGTRADAEGLLQKLTDSPLGATTEGWTVYAPEHTYTAGYLPGRLTLRSAGAPAPTPGAPTTLLDGLPGVDGCAMWFRAGEAAEKLGGVSAFVPTRGGAPLLVRMETPSLPPALFAGRPAPPVGGSSDEAPAMLLTVGLPLDDILSALGDDPKMPAAELAALRDHVRIQGGLTVALFGNPRAANFVAVLPVTAADGSPLPAKRVAKVLAKVAREMGGDAKVKKGRMQAVVEGRAVWAQAAGGRLVIGTNELAVEQTVAGTGTPWISPAFAEFAGAWAIAFGLSDQGAGGPNFQGGLRGRDQGVEASLSLTGVNAEAMAMAMGMASAIAVPNFLEMQLRAKRAEVPGNVDGIRTAQLAYQAAFDQFQPVPAAPRPTATLGKEQVAWSGDAAWDRLGWRPDGEVRGTYWVEVAADGADFTVHGMIDADGDGNPAHYTATRDQGATQVTGPDVY